MITLRLYKILKQIIYKINTLNKNKIEIVKLWENASPTSSFAKQTINLDMTGYDYIDVYVVRNKATDANFQSSAYRLRLPVDTHLIFIEPPNINNVEYYARGITITSSKDKITFTSGMRRALNLSNLSTNTDEVVIPVEIYGIKGVL